jgi:AbrB family looped-hinge helix DNA binding protein
MKQPKFYGSTVISDKGQVVIPVEARNALNLEKGEKLLVMGMNDSSITLMKLSSFKKISDELIKRQEEIGKAIRDL